jgi:hypothetical protein
MAKQANRMMIGGFVVIAVILLAASLVVFGSGRGLISEDAPLIVELENTLREISDAARWIRQLANTLDQRPEALIQGKGDSGGK